MGKHFPGFLGYTLYQSRRRLLRYYKAANLELVRDFPSSKYLGYPVFIYDLSKMLARRISNSRVSILNDDE